METQITFPSSKKLWLSKESLSCGDFVSRQESPIRLKICMHAFIQEISFNGIKGQLTLRLSKKLEKLNKYFPNITEEQVTSYQ